MNPNYFNDLYRQYGSIKSFLTLKPEEIINGTHNPIIACWRILAISSSLNDEGELRRSSSWLTNGSVLLSNISDSNTIILTEWNTTLGSVLLNAGEIGQALDFLQIADSQLRDLSQQSLSALSNSATATRLQIANQIRLMINALDPENSIGLPSDNLKVARSLIKEWFCQRFIPKRVTVITTLGRALSSIGEFERARTIYTTTLDWLYSIINSGIIEKATQNLELRNTNPDRKIVDKNLVIADLYPSMRVFIYLVQMARGDMEASAGNLEESVKSFEDASNLYSRNLIDEQDMSRLNMALGNKANSLVELSRFKEAQDIYKIIEENFAYLGDNENALRVRHASLFASWKENPNINIEEPVRQVVEEYEQNLRQKKDIRNLQIYKKIVEPAYTLLLTLLAQKKDADPERAKNYLKVVGALREPYTLATAYEIQRTHSSREIQELDSKVNNPVWIIGSYLSYLPSTVLIFVQSGVNALTFFALRGGNDPLERRITLQLGPKELLDAIKDLLYYYYEEQEAILAGRKFYHEPASENLVETCKRVWTLLPEGIRSYILSSDTVLYSPDPFGNIDDVPLEILRTPQGWLGVTHAISRQTSLRTILEMLSPNRTPSLLSNYACTVRAEDPQGFDKLTFADREVSDVTRYLRILGLEPRDITAPSVSDMNEALNFGYRVIHYAGHGIANTIEEGLPLSSNNILRPNDFNSLAGNKTPIVYLSSCEVGRSRYVPGGAHTGIATRLIEKGSPAVIACLQAVSDDVASRMCTMFYKCSKSLPIGRALSISRDFMSKDGINPVCWGVQTLYGDPNTTLSPILSQTINQTSSSTRSWSTYLNRYLASRSQEDLKECYTRVSDLMKDKKEPSLGHIKQVVSWLSGLNHSTQKRTQAKCELLCSHISKQDLIGGASLRMLMAMELTDAKKKKSSDALSELAIAENYSRNLFDLIAWAAVASKISLDYFDKISMRGTISYLEEALGILNGWTHYRPSLVSLRDKVKAQLELLNTKLVIDSQDLLDETGL
jgi:tetratricopeptide (TPR) repeat protein